MVTPMMGSVWYIDSGAAFHITDNKEYFSNLEEKDLHTIIGIVTFEREFGSPLTLKDGIYVPGLKNNLVSVAILEDPGWDVKFSKGNSFSSYSLRIG